VRYLRFTYRIFAVIALAVLAFIVGTYLPLSIEWFLHGDPGEPGGAAMIVFGFVLGTIGALTTAIFSLVKLRPWKEFSK
jgi:uncharacterized membrane protein YccC